MSEQEILKSIDHKLLALVALSALSIFGKGDELRVKPEILLSSVGLENSEIAKVLGKSLPAIQKALQRAKNK